MPGTVHSRARALLFHNTKMPIVALIFGSETPVELTLPRVGELPVSDRFMAVVSELLVFDVSSGPVVGEIFGLTRVVRARIRVKFHNERVTISILLRELFLRN